MLIKCPNCRSIYDLPDNLVDRDGLKMRCAECHEIWTAYPQDALKDTNKRNRNDIQKMFERVSKETAPLFEDSAPKVVEKIRVVNVTRYRHRINLILLFIAFISLIGILYYMRYDIVRFLPQAESLYDKIFVSSIPYGKDLKFQNMTTREFVEDNVAKIEITGMIYNIGHYQSALPPLKVEITDKATDNLLAESTHLLSLPRLQPGYRILFNIIVVNPTPSGKSIYVKFADHQ